MDEITCFCAVPFHLEHRHLVFLKLHSRMFEFSDSNRISISYVFVSLEISPAFDILLYELGFVDKFIDTLIISVSTTRLCDCEKSFECSYSRTYAFHALFELGSRGGVGVFEICEH